MPPRRRILLIGQGCLSAALVAYLARKVNIGQAGAAVLGANPFLLAAAVIQLGVPVFLTALRWRLVARNMKGDLPFASALRFVWIGAFFGQVLPASVGGDAVRMWLYWLRCRRRQLAIHSVALERLAMVVVLLLLVLVIQPGLAARGAPISITILAAAVLAVMVAGLVVLLLSARLLARYKKRALVRMVAGLAGDARRLFTNPRAGSTLAALSLVAHLNTVVAFWIIANALGLGITLADCLVLVPVITLAATLPISLSGWGVREGVAISLFGLVGVSSASALALSILFGLAAILVALPGSILWFMRERNAKMGLANWSADEPA